MLWTYVLIAVNFTVFIISMELYKNLLSLSETVYCLFQFLALIHVGDPE